MNFILITAASSILLMISGYKLIQIGTHRALNFKWYKYQQDLQKDFDKSRSNGGVSYFDIINSSTVKKGVYLALDTNVLLNDLYLIHKLKESGFKLLISETVRSELDKHKGNKYDAELSNQARISLKNISDLYNDKHLQIVPSSKEYTKSIGMDPSNNDDLIIASYEKFGQDYVFITGDVNARLTAVTRNIKVNETQAKVKIKIKPGFKTKLSGLIVYCIGFGVMMGSWYLTSDDQFETKINKKAAEVEGANRLTYSYDTQTIDKAGNYTVFSEYQEIYLGSHHEKWGGIAVVDVKESKKSIRSFGGVTVTFVGHIPKGEEIADYHNELKFTVKVNDKTFVGENSTLSKIEKGGKVMLPSKDIRVLFHGANFTGKTDIHVDESIDLNNHAWMDQTIIEVSHKVTEEILFTLPLLPNKSNK